MKTVFAAIVVSSLAMTPLMAHEVEIDEHATVVPIPAYDPPAGGADVAVTLTAMNAFLDSFEGPFKGKMLEIMHREFGSEDRANWHNVPQRLANREGLALADMSDVQRALMFAFLSAALGEKGYAAVANVMAAEAFLVKHTPQRSTWLQVTPENYFFTYYGDPSEAGPWGWQLTGHHLALNLSYENGKVISMTPTFIGVEPIVFSINGQNFRANENLQLAGHAVYASLDDAQRAKATLVSAPDGIVLGAGMDGVILPQVGISASDLNANQQDLLLEAIRQWVGVQPDADADARIAGLRENIDALSYAWIGSGTVNEEAYMRIQGPDLLIEMMSMVSDMADGATGHYHTITRNPSWDYGVFDD